MPAELVTGNHAAGYALSTAAEANRDARGATCGIYPITPQTEIVEYVARFPFTKTQVVPVESEHSAMGVSIGASLAGGRAFTASSSNGIAYMVENIMVAGFYRLPIVMVAVNRTLGPPWNIWADQGDTLMLRDFPWIQFYCEDNQEVLDTTLLAFRLAEDRFWYVHADRDVFTWLQALSLGHDVEIRVRDREGNVAVLSVPVEVVP